MLLVVVNIYHRLRENTSICSKKHVLTIKPKQLQPAKRNYIILHVFQRISATPFSEVPAVFLSLYSNAGRGQMVVYLAQPTWWLAHVTEISI